MTPLDRCRAVLDDATTMLRAAVPTGHEQLPLTLLHDNDALTPGEVLPRAARPGWNLALRLCLEAGTGRCNEVAYADPALSPAWAARFLTDCDQLALAELVLAQCAWGHLQLQQRGSRTFVAWATTRRLSTEQRERADFDWWSAQLTQQAAPQLAGLDADRPRIAALLGHNTHATTETPGYVAERPEVDRFYRQLGLAHLARFACQHSYPTDAAIGGATIGDYADILALLIGWLLREHDRRASAGDVAHRLWDEPALTAALATALDADPEPINRALQPFILDRDNAAHHGTPLNRAAPPLIRLDERRLVPSARGLLTEPLIFLTRELRRRHAQEYHNSAHLREQVFRQDVYHLFADRRFIRSPGRVELKVSREARTDLDALVFDRKTGTLGIFELKAQDPFARSVEERQRQRDYFLQANRQVSAVLQWVQRNGPDDLLARFDDRAGKQLRVQKVHAFVLGRYLAHFAGGPLPDRRAAWGSWPQVLQLVGQRPFGSDDRNPLTSLFAKLRDATPRSAPANADTQTIAIGDLRLYVYPSFAAMKAAEATLA